MLCFSSQLVTSLEHQSAMDKRHPRLETDQQFLSLVAKHTWFDAAKIDFCGEVQVPYSGGDKLRDLARPKFMQKKYAMRSDTRNIHSLILN